MSAADIPAANPEFDFYLSFDARDVQPRGCWSRGRRTYGGRDDMMLVAIEPPLFDESTREEIYWLLLASKFENESLWSVSHWPVPVYILKLLQLPPDQKEIRVDQASIIHWGFLHTCDDKERQ